jgi:FecR protein
MRSRRLLFSASLILFCWFLVTAIPAVADASHARIIRLSLVQGDVRFTRDVKGDPLASDKATWEAAELNLPIRQGYVLATDQGRAEIEFENGSMAFLGNNTVLEFYDLSLQDGAKTTRLVLRQGTASFSVNPSNGDYFSVTGGDFSVEAEGRSAFRLDNFDDGSTVNVSKGKVSVLDKKGTAALVKGQSLSVRAGDPTSASVGNATATDDFDRWVSGRIETVQAATSVAQQYVNTGGYSSGLASLYTYGAFYPTAGFGNCWRPYGVGLGWSPFDSGFWYSDASFGTAFIGNQPWGWLPYHYGGWVFDPGYGWLWAPSGFGSVGYYPGWSPVTGVWLRSRGGPVGIVPVHPLDARGKTPINLTKGVFPVSGGTISRSVTVAAGEQWKVVKNAPKNTIATNTNIVATAAPARVFRTMVGGNLGAGSVAIDHGSSLAYDASQRRFVSANSAGRPQNGVAGRQTLDGKTNVAGSTANNGMRVAGGAPVPGNTRVSAPPTRTSVPAARASMPPPSPHSSGMGRAGSSGGSVSQPSSRGASAPSSAGAARAPSSAGSASGPRPH